MNICIQTGDIVDRLGIKEGYKAIKDAGFGSIDWNLDHAWCSSDYTDENFYGKCVFEKSLEECMEYYKEELEVIRENGLEIYQAHAPFPCYKKDLPGFTDYAIEMYKRNIEFCDRAGCKNLIIHGASLSFDDSRTQEEIDEINLKLYTSLIPTLLENNVTVCLENLFTGHNGVCYHGHCGVAQAAAAFVDRLNGIAGKEVFGFCLDTGHANLLHHDLYEFIKVMGKRITALHIHDNNGAHDQHMAPLTGTVAWERFCRGLKETGYDGDLSFETFNQTNIVMNFDKSLVYAWMELIYKTGNCFREKITG